MSDEYIIAIFYAIILFVVIRLIGMIWMGNMYDTRVARRDHIFTEPNPNHIQVPHNSLFSNMFEQYLRAGCTVALDASYLMSHYQQIFAELSFINPRERHKIIISQDTIDRIAGLKNTEHGVLANHVINLIDQHCLQYPQIFEKVTMDDRQYEILGINRDNVDEKELAAYGLENRYRLTNVVLFSVNGETQAVGRKFGLDVFPLHKWV